jgi:hypothetical protein
MEAALLVVALAGCEARDRGHIEPEPAPLHVPADTGVAVFFERGPVETGTSRAEIASRLGEPDSVTVRTVSNRHDPAMTDSIITLYYAGLEAEVHIAGYDGKEMLAALAISSNRYLQESAVVRIGDDGAAIRAALGEPDDASDERLLYICDDCLAAGQEAVRFVMRNDAVARIELRYWVD